MLGRLRETHSFSHPSLLVLSLSVLWSIGCVKQSTYDAVQADIADARTTVASTQQDVAQLNAQIARLQEVNKLQEGLMTESQEALKKEQEADTHWQAQARAHMDSLVARLNALQQQRRWLERETENAVSTQQELEAKVAAYKSDLDGRPFMPESAVAPATRDASSTMTPSTATTAAAPISPQIASPSPEPPKTTSPPPAPRPQPVPQDESWFSTIKGWLGSVWRSIFS
jgi:cell division protein FtsB